MALVVAALKQLEEAIPVVGTDNEGGMALMKAVGELRKHFPADAASQGMQKTAQEKFMMQQRQENPLMNILKMAGQQGGAGGAGAGAPPAGGMPPGAPPPG